MICDICYNSLLELVLKTNKNTLVDYFKQHVIIIVTVNEDIEPKDIMIGPNIRFKCIEIDGDHIKYMIDYLKLDEYNLYLAT